MKFPESNLAHKYLDGFVGIEIGGSAHNPFGISGCLNVDIDDNSNSIYKKHQLDMCGEILKVDIIASGDKLPFENESLDYVLSSHVIEHFYDPISTIQEWLRVVKNGGYVFMIVPHKDRTFDAHREITTINDLLERQKKPHNGEPHPEHHFSVWRTQDFIDMCVASQFNVVDFQDVDDKVGNGFTVVIQKQIEDG